VNFEIIQFQNFRLI